MTNKQLSFIDKTITALLLVVFAGIVVHAPLTVWLSSHFPASELFIKSWKEVLLLVAALLTAAQLTRLGSWRLVLSSSLLRLVAVIGLFDVLLVVVIPNLPTSEMAGLLIGLRYYLFFGLLAVHLQRFPLQKMLFMRTFIGGAALVAVFSLLQVFVLPKDILSTIGYNDTTIKPYLTVDLNHDYIRINSTFRGPNPLGAYAVIVLSFLAALAVRKKWPLQRRHQVLLGVIALGMMVSLWWSYSRSAIVGAVVAAGVIIVASGVLQAVSKKTVAIASAVAVVIMMCLVLIASTQQEMISNVVFHSNQNGGSAHKSDDGHKSSLEKGVAGVVKNPLGHGIGTSGSASLYTKRPNIVENQYIATAWQSGIIGLGLTVSLFVAVMLTVWRTRREALSLAVLASGLAMAVIGLVLPVWTDDTVSIVWWGLAAISVSVPLVKVTNKGEVLRDKTRHKKTSRAA